MKTVYKILYRSWTGELKGCIKVAGNKVQIYRMRYEIYDCAEILSIIPLERTQAARMISSKKVIDRTVGEEYYLAKIEERQPLCVYCGEPLGLVEYQDEVIAWTWNPTTREMEKKTTDSSGEVPYCDKCEAQDGDFIDYDTVNF